MTPDNRQLARRWIDALRSGKYLQGTGNLCQITDDTRRFCCLGVLAEIANFQTIPGEDLVVVVGPTEIDGVVCDDCDDRDDCSDVDIPDRLWPFKNLDQEELIRRNDGSAGYPRHTFMEIADYLEGWLGREEETTA